MAEVFASGTKVPVQKTRAEIETLLEKHKARATAVFTQEDQERWRALLLAIEAKLVSVQSGIETFEEAFMAHIVMPDGSTVGEQIKPRIASAYKNQKMVPLLPSPKGLE